MAQPAESSSQRTSKTKLGDVLFPDAAVEADGGGRRVEDETGRMEVELTEVDFIGSRYTQQLMQDRVVDVAAGTQDEQLLIDALSNIVDILRSNAVQRRLVRRKLFLDPTAPAAAAETASQRSADKRILAGNINMYIDLIIGERPVTNNIVLELVLEILAIYLLGANSEQKVNKPRSLDASSATTPQAVTVSAAAGGSGKKKKKEKTDVIEQAAAPEDLGTPEEFTYVLKCGVVKVLDMVIADEKHLGVRPYLLGDCAQTLCWAMGIYLALMKQDDPTAVHAYQENSIRTCWDIITRKTRMKDPDAARVANVKTSALQIVQFLGQHYTPEATDPKSANMINLNTRSIKEMVKLLHHHPDLHGIVLGVIVMITQKESNSLMLKRAGMLEYLTCKVLPYFSAKNQHAVPQLVILLNTWITNIEDLQYFCHFQGVPCLVFHMKQAISETASHEGEGAANWEDMTLHGLSILYKLSDNVQYHMKMVVEDGLSVLLECLRVIDPLKSMYHLNGFIAALYSLRNLTAGSVEVRKRVIDNEHFTVLSHLLSTPSLPINCLIHLLFLFSTLSRDEVRGQVDKELRALIMNHVFLAVFKPLCKIVRLTPLGKKMDDSQITVLCLALQTLSTLVTTAKEENPLLCIQIEGELPLKHIKYLSKERSKTPFPELAGQVLGMVYLTP
eukprot:TRINITY_DN14505_c0_g1_i1.p1 TRINITY_DN14505_c0_g1~~TRINITY_DN14505_c0_g1_i1.p1  ORF type:complete len:674 (+),score=291.54 TRINITY_DN14505_c0_g1_i1:90-2111(+)